jgi:hypothetical protein
MPPVRRAADIRRQANRTTALHHLKQTLDTSSLTIQTMQTTLTALTDWITALDDLRSFWTQVWDIYEEFTSPGTSGQAGTAMVLWVEVQRAHLEGTLREVENKVKMARVVVQESVI